MSFTRMPGHWSRYELVGRTNTGAQYSVAIMERSIHTQVYHVQLGSFMDHDIGNLHKALCDFESERQAEEERRQETWFETLRSMPLPTDWGQWTISEREF